jgi:hypothetical protein
MPKFAEDSSLEEVKTANFGFTAQDMEELEASGYTIVDIAVDCSYSTSSFIAQMEDAVLGAITALKGDPNASPPIKPHPRADQMLVRLTRFADNIKEVFGYILLNVIEVSQLKGSIVADGATALFDSIISAGEAAAAMGKKLQDDDYDANGIFILLTDGLNNRGKYSSGRTGSRYYPSKQQYHDDLGVVNKALKMPRQSENLESYVSIMIGVNCAECEEELREIHELAGFTQDFMALHDASPETISAIGAFISESVSSQSEARGTGGPSQSIANTI